MTARRLTKDPYSIIIAGVGGQGNVIASRLFSNMLVSKGFIVTIGDTFGASQRGGSVMSHIRISEKSLWSPQVPRGRVDVVVTLEPIEAIRVLVSYGNPSVKVLANTRAIYPSGVISGSSTYPNFEEISKALKQLTAKVWFLSATDEAIRLGNPILGNVIMLGALSSICNLPVGLDDFRMVLSHTLSEEKMAANLKAFDLGFKLIQKTQPL